MPSTSSEILRAGAGSGKTTALVQRVFEKSLSLIEDKNPKSLIVCTFTRKATQELKERLLEKACLAENEKLIEYFSSSSFLVSTIHGVLSLFLKQYGFHLGLEPSFEIMSSFQEELISKQVLREVLLLEDPHLLQYESFSSLLLSCKKYSETKMSFKEDISFFQKEDILKMYKKYYKDLSLQFEQENLDDLCQFFSKLSEDSEAYKMEDFLALYKKTRPKGELLKSVKKELENSFVLDQKKALSAIEMQKRFEKVASLFTKKLFEKKISQSLLTYSDLETFSFELLKQKPHIGKLFSKTYDSWFIDEYQDTSPLQVKLFEGLKGGAFDFCVGDPNQSIYFFRGARYEVFEQKEKVSKTNPPLLKNYRSNPSLVAFFNDFFQNSHTISKVQVGRKGLLKEDPVVFFGDFEKEDGELQSILHHILRLKKGKKQDQGSKKNKENEALKQDSIAVLCRTEDVAYNPITYLVL